MKIKASEYSIEVKAIPCENGLYGIIRVHGKRRGSAFSSVCSFMECDFSKIKIYDSPFFYGTYKELSRSLRVVPDELEELFRGDLLESIGLRQSATSTPSMIYREINIAGFGYKPWEERTKFLHAVLDKIKNIGPNFVTKLCHRKYDSKFSEGELSKKINNAFKTMPNELKEDAMRKREFYKIARVKSENTCDFAKPELTEESLGILPSWALQIVETYKKD